MSTSITNDPDANGRVTGLMNQVLSPVETPPAVKHRLRDEILEVARQRAENTVRLERDRRAHTWIIGAAIGTVVAVAGGVWLVLRNRLMNDSGSTGEGAGN